MYEKTENDYGGFVRLALYLRGSWFDYLYRLYGYKMDKLITALHIRKPCGGELPQGGNGGYTDGYVFYCRCLVCLWNCGRRV